jgi:hypothetical protein
MTRVKYKVERRACYMMLNGRGRGVEGGHMPPSTLKIFIIAFVKKNYVPFYP